MSRTSVTFAAATSPSPGTATETGRVFLAGRAQQGPLAPQLVSGRAEYEELFGSPSGGRDLYDGFDLYKAEGGGNAWIVRAAGPAPVKAARVLGGNLTVTAKSAGAYANTITAQWDNTLTKLIIVSGSDTEEFTGATIAALLAKTATSELVDVTGTLPTADVAAAALSGGDDDYANVAWADVLDLFPAELGVGAVAVPGQDYTAVGAELAAHAAQTKRLAILTLPAGSAAAAAVTAAAAVAAYPAGSDKSVVVWPHVVVSGVGTVDPAGYVAGKRAAAHAINPKESPIRRDIGRSSGNPPYTTDVDVAATDTEFAALLDAGVSPIVQSLGSAQLDGWYTAAPTVGNANLRGAQFADLTNAIAAQADAIADQFVGRSIDGRGEVLASFKGALDAMLAGYVSSGALWQPSPDDPGFRTDVGSDVNTAASLAAGQLKAAVKVRLAPNTEYVSISVAAADASAAI